MKLILNFEISHLVALCTVLYPFLAYYGYGSNTFALILALLLFIYIYKKGIFGVCAPYANVLLYSILLCNSCSL